MTPAIITKALSRNFGEITAVRDIDFQVEEGEVFGVLGPNGAGKTTLVRLLNGILTPSSGNALVFGMDPAREGDRVRRITGVLTESPSHYERLTAYQNLSFYAAMSGVPEGDLPSRVNQMLSLFGLQDRARAPVGGFSKGMKQRLALARALIHEPKMLFLDEPTAGLDPEAARQVDDLIADLVEEEGRTVFLCTHNLPEAQALCDRLMMLNRGRMLAIGSIPELTARIWQALPVDLEFLVPPPPGVRKDLRSMEGVNLESEDPTRFTLRLKGKEQIPAVVAMAVEGGAEILRVSPREYSLEEIYFAIQKGQEAGA